MVLGIALALALGPGRAFAYFAAGGGLGTAQGATGDLLPLVVLPATAGSPATTLLPAATADLIVTVRNPNSTGVTIQSVSQGGGVTVQGGSGCTSDPAWPGTLGNSGVSVVATSGLSVPVSAGATVTFHLGAAASMAATSASGCQGATFQIPVTVTVRQ